MSHSERQAVARMESGNNAVRNRLLAVLFVGVLMGALDIAIVGPALPAIQRHFGVEDRSLAWIYTIYVLCNLVGTPLWARLSDTFGRRAIYVLDVLLFALGSAMVALAPSFAIVLFGRAVQGLGSGGIFPVASAVIGDTFPAEKRGSALGLIGAVFGIAFIIGPVIGGVLLLVGWQWLFVINLPVAMGIIVGGWSLLPTARPTQRGNFDTVGMAILAILLVSLAYGINRLDTTAIGESLQSSNVWPYLLIALALLPVFVWIEQRTPEPVLRPGLYRARQMQLVVILATGAGLIEAGIAFIPQLAVAAYHVTASTASFMLLPLVVGVAVGSPVVGRLLDRYGSRNVVLGGTVLMSVGMLGLALWGAQQMPFFYMSTTLTGFGIASLIGAPLRYIVLGEARPEERAAAQGSVNLFIGAGQMAGGAAIGAIAGSLGGGVHGYATAYLIAGMLSACLIPVSLGLKTRAQELQARQRGEPFAGQPVRPGD
ncbi:MAG: MFS transporter [Anaerolineae bacterium]|nr:MFS transporter [Anaerolineae bacterium]MDW8070588.1 MFS transporter [Anaerolineae bacterium]